MKIKNINDIWGMPVEFNSVGEMERAIESCGYDLPVNGLREGVDYECLPDRYRWDGSTGTLYEWSTAHRAYLFAAKGNGRTESETIADYENQLSMEG